MVGDLVEQIMSRRCADRVPVSPRSDAALGDAVSGHAGPERGAGLPGRRHV